ncbi:hypothetical protein PMAYCL1PPCAC_30895, partial [Pristionchus mayeri]
GRAKFPRQHPLPAEEGVLREFSAASSSHLPSHSYNSSRSFISNESIRFLSFHGYEKRLIRSCQREATCEAEEDLRPRHNH